MPLSYDSNSIVPAPFFSIGQQFIQLEDGTRIGGIYNITVHGKLVAWKGSPRSDGTFWNLGGYPADETIAADSRLTVVLKKQQALRDLFSVDGRSFEVSGYDGFAPLKCNPRVKSIEFPDGEGKGGNWTEYSEYVINLEADYINGLTSSDVPSNLISKLSQEWGIELLDETKGTYRLTRNVSATGRRVFDETGGLLDGNEAWENARDYVLNTLGLGIDNSKMIAAGVIDGNSLQAFNYIRAQHINETSGIYSVTESWVCYDPGSEPPAIHDQSITCRTNIQDGKTVVNVEGTVVGFEQRNTTSHSLIKSRWTNAEAKWSGYVKPNLFTNAGAATSLNGAAVTLNPVPGSSSVGKNEIAGSVNYQYEFDNRVTPSTPGAMSEIVTVSNNNAVDIFAQIQIPGRPLGPIVQPMGTVTSHKRNIGIEIQMPPSTQGNTASAPNTNGIVLALIPTGSIVLVEQDDEVWIANTGRYTRTSSYLWQP